MKKGFILLLAWAFSFQVFAGVLEEKAYAYDRWYQRWHSPGYGGTCEVIFADPELTQVKMLDGIGDSTIWTGTYLASQAFRFAVEHSPEALKNARKAFRALHYHLIATGKKGLLARYVGPLRLPFWTKGEEGCLKNERCHIIPCPEGAGFSSQDKCFWLGDVSRDQYTGWWFGIALAYDLINDEELRSWIKKDVRTIIDQLIKDDFVIIDVDGKPTGAGKVMAAMKFDWLKISAHILKDSELEKRYEKEVSLHWLWNIIASDRRLNQYFEYFAFNLDHQTYYNLIRLEDSPHRKKYFQKVFKEKVWGYTRGTDNVFFDYIAMAVLGRTDPELVARSREILEKFPSPPNRLVRVELKPLPVRKSSVQLCKFNYDVVWLACKLGIAKEEYFGGKLMYFFPIASEPQPFECRPKSDFIWQRSPYPLADVWSPRFSCQDMSRTHKKKICTDPSAGIDRVKIEMQRGYKVYPGVDYLVAYWMGRYYGFIDSDW